MSKKLAFISRHVPTARQHELAEARGCELIHVGDRDAFTSDPHEFADYSGVVVVHPAAALRYMRTSVPVGVFENSNRAPEGAPVSFEAVALHLYVATGQLTCDDIGNQILCHELTH